MRAQHIKGRENQKKNAGVSTNGRQDMECGGEEERVGEREREGGRVMERARLEATA
jgi:hypothetical protein